MIDSSGQHGQMQSSSLGIVVVIIAQRLEERSQLELRPCSVLHSHCAPCARYADGGEEVSGVEEGENDAQLISVAAMHWRVQRIALRLRIQRRNECTLLMRRIDSSALGSLARHEWNVRVLQ